VHASTGSGCAEYLQPAWQLAHSLELLPRGAQSPTGGVRWRADAATPTACKRCFLEPRAQVRFLPGASNDEVTAGYLEAPLPDATDARAGVGRSRPETRSSGKGGAPALAHRTPPPPNLTEFVAAAGDNRLVPESSRRIFLSYGHDETATLAQRLVSDLRDHGHEVWFDEQLRAGSDWEHALELALEWAAEAADLGRVIFLITPHSARRPDGYCLNELARAIDLGLPVVPVMVVWCKPPLSIARLQWVDLQAADQYERRFGQLCEALETGIVEFEGTQSRLLRVLEPLSFEADVAQSLPSFVGREWIFDRLDDWLADKRGSSVYLLTGEPGIGKTALAIKIRDRYPQVAAYHLCRYGDSEKANPVRAISPSHTSCRRSFRSTGSGCSKCCRPRSTDSIRSPVSSIDCLSSRSRRCRSPGGRSSC